MRRLPFFAIAAFAIGTVTGCMAPMRVSAHHEPAVDFTEFKTFAWEPADSLPTGDPRLDNNPFFHDYFEGAVERELAARGVEHADWATPDLVLHYHANVRQRFRIAGTDSDSPSCSGSDCNGGITEYEAGTFVLDMVDPYTGKLVWRGWAETSVDGVIDDQDWLRDHLREAVKRMMRLYPVAAAPTATH